MAFRKVFEEPIVASRQPEASENQKELGAERAAELTRLTQMFILRRTQEVNNQYLPPKGEINWDLIKKNYYAVFFFKKDNRQH